MLTAISLGAIRAYQKHLSPRKGYSCALRLEDGTAIGCSGYAKIRIGEVGFLRAIPDIRNRLKLCRSAAEDRAARRRRRRDAGLEETCDCLEGTTYCGSYCGSTGRIPSCGL
ncbi:membrane protein insertion efficiency factor YidD, partial [Roseibium sp.]